MSACHISQIMLPKRGSQRLHLTAGFDILAVHLIAEHPCVYVLQKHTTLPVDVEVFVFSTGAMLVPEGLVHVGSVLWRPFDGSCYHVFMKHGAEHGN